MPPTQDICSELLATSKLRPFPSVALRLLHLIQQDDTSFDELGDLLATDAALSATVLRAANSPLFGARYEIKSIPLSLATLGMERISLLILAASALHTLPHSVASEHIRLWWRHNLATALLCKQLSDGGKEGSYMCGLLHSTGQLILSDAFPGRYESLLTESAASGTQLLELERNHYGTDHCEVGAAMLRKWNIPEDIVDAAACHHHPEEGMGKWTMLVHTACLVANFLSFAVNPAAHVCLRDLPPLAQEVINNEQFCREIAQKVEALEAGLGA